MLVPLRGLVIPCFLALPALLPDPLYLVKYSPRNGEREIEEKEEEEVRRKRREIGVKAYIQGFSVNACRSGGVIC